jgi:hypothetical protein
MRSGRALLAVGVEAPLPTPFDRAEPCAFTRAALVGADRIPHALAILSFLSKYFTMVLRSWREHAVWETLRFFPPPAACWPGITQNEGRGGVLTILR